MKEWWSCAAAFLFVTHDKKEKLVRKSWLFELVNKFPSRDYEQFIWRWTPIPIMSERSNIFQSIPLLKEILGWFSKRLPEKIRSQFDSAKRVEKLGRPLFLSPWTRSAFCECLGSWWTTWGPGWAHWGTHWPSLGPRLPPSSHKWPLLAPKWPL